MAGHARPYRLRCCPCDTSMWLLRPSRAPRRYSGYRPSRRGALPVAIIQINQQHRQVGRADAADAAGLAEAGRADAAQLLARLGAELRDGGVVEVRRDRLATPAAGTARPAPPAGRCSRRTSPPAPPARPRPARIVPAPAAPGPWRTAAAQSISGPPQPASRACRRRGVWLRR